MGIWELFWFRHFSLFLDPKPTGAYLGSDFPRFQDFEGGELLPGSWGLNL